MHPATKIDSWLVNHRGAYFDLVLAGRTFGGRAGEASQRLADVTTEADTLVFRFEPTETLTIVRPSGVTIKGTDLIVREADEVTFGWHYYGRAQSPENWCTESYRFEGEMVLCTRTGPITAALASTERIRRGRAAAVELRCCG